MFIIPAKLFPRLIAAFVLLLASSSILAQDRLSRIEAKLEGSGIEQIPYQQIAQRIDAKTSPRPLILFDVREPNEYAVGHLPEAIWISPDTDVREFIEQYADKLAGSDVVFYCSTGRRSSELAQQVKDQLLATQSSLSPPANMKGGVFRWHDAALPLKNSAGSTTLIHPFNWTWRWSLERPEQTSFQPDFTATGIMTDDV